MKHAHTPLLSLTAAALALGLAAGPALAYNSGSLSAKIHESCKDFAVTQAGVYTATCNVSGGTASASIDLDSYIANDGGELNWDGAGGFASTCDNLYLSTNGVGLGATCAGADADQGIWLCDYLENSNGDFAERTTPIEC